VNELTILVQNAQSLKNKIDIMEALLLDKNIPIACVSETWISENQKELVTIDNYDFAASFNRSQRQGGGVAMLLQQNIEFTERKDISILSIEFIFECCAVEIPKENILLINIYRPDRDVETFFDCLNRLLCKVQQIEKNRRTFIVGDFNINMLGNSPNKNRLIDTMLCYNLKQIVKQPTREINNSSTCIDLVFTNQTKCNVEVEDNGISDHKSVLLTLERQDTQKTQNPWHAHSRIYSEKNMLLFKQELAKINWNSVFSEKSNLNQNFQAFHSILQNILNTYLPKRHINLVPTNRKKTWLTKGLKLACRHKRQLKTFVNTTNNLIIHEHYKKYEKILKKCIKKSKKINHINKIKRSNNKVKTMWTLINNITRRNKKHIHKNITIKTNNTILESPLQIANLFNEHFASVGESSAPAPCSPAAAAGATTPSTGRPVIYPTTNSIYISPVNEDEITKLIRKLKNKKSYGIDELPPALIKKCNAELAAPLTRLINQSFDEGAFPELLKIAKIKPILKPGGTANNQNQYRPIALLPTVSKIFEKAMANRLYNFLEKYNVLDSNQHGFRKCHSTTLAVYKYITHILEHLRVKQYSIGLLLDMTKAYDKVSHEILLAKLYGMGVRGMAHKWFQSYLQNRKQYVQIDYYDHQSREVASINSQLRQTTCSLPQGSILACTLFLAYINDLPKILNKSTKCVMFADDVSLLFSATDSIEANLKLSTLLHTVKKWLAEHNLDINLQKTKIIQFKPTQKKTLELELQINNKTIEVVNDFKLLGITIDSGLNWKAHIQSLKTKIIRFIYALGILKANTDFESALSVYFAYIYSGLRYGVLLWGDSTDAKEIFVLQKKCIRILANLHIPNSCRPHFIKYNLLTLPSIYILEAALFVRQHTELFPPKIDTYKTRSQYRNKLLLPRPNLAIYKNGPQYKCIQIFNKIPNAIKYELNDKTFNSKLKSLLIENCYYTVNSFLEDNTLDKYDTELI
jgi:hypothetical protein